MALRILGSKTVKYAVKDTEILVVGPFPKTRAVRVMADVLIFVAVKSDDVRAPMTGYPLSDLASEDIEVPGGHYLHIAADEPGAVWLTEF